MLQTAGLPPGRALDVGCGEGADAIWLAQRGWSVTALDVSTVALDRARRAAENLQVEVTWVLGSISDPRRSEPYDLVSLLYPALPPTTPVDAVLGWVAPGGILLVVGHAQVETAHGHGPESFLQVSEIAHGLGGGWVIERHEQRRRIDPPPGAEHVLDEVLRARRLN